MDTLNHTGHVKRVKHVKQKQVYSKIGQLLEMGKNDLANELLRVAAMKSAQSPREYKAIMTFDEDAELTTLDTANKYLWANRRRFAKSKKASTVRWVKAKNGNV